ncbi:MAG: hypothetical protein ACREBU_00515 [Nitrososphaera sp.]
MAGHGGGATAGRLCRRHRDRRPPTRVRRVRRELTPVNAVTDFFRVRPTRKQLNAELWRSRATLGYHNLGARTWTLGSSTRIVLEPIGLLESLYVHVKMTVTLAAGMVLSPFAPYNLIERIQLIAPDGTLIHMLAGEHLFALSSLRARKLQYRQAGIFYASPLLPISGAAQTLEFFMLMPVAFPGSLDGIFLLNSSDGEMALVIDWDNALFELNNDDRVYSGPAAGSAVVTAGTSPTVTVWQAFLDSAEPPPIEPLLLRYRMEGANRITDSLAGGTERLLAYPTSRLAYAVAISYLGAGAAAIGNVSRFRRIIGSNQQLYDANEEEHIALQREHLSGSDLPAGLFVLAHEPVYSGFARSHQLGLTPKNTNSGNTRFELSYESLTPLI